MTELSDVSGDVVDLSLIHIYNKTKGYSMIISNTGFDNLLYADSVYNITREILDGLNARSVSYTHLGKA